MKIRNVYPHQWMYLDKSFPYMVLVLSCHSPLGLEENYFFVGCRERWFRGWYCNNSPFWPSVKTFIVSISHQVSSAIHCVFPSGPMSQYPVSVEHNLSPLMDQWCLTLGIHTAGLPIRYQPTNNQFAGEPEGLRHFWDHHWKALGKENSDLPGLFLFRRYFESYSI